MIQQAQHQLIAAALAQSFHKWAVHHPRFKRMYKSMPPEMMQIIKTGLSEVQALNPISWDTWWLLEHNRFRGKEVRQEHKRNLTQLMHSFLGDFARGKVNEPDSKTEKKQRRKATPDQGGADTVCGNQG